MEKEKHNHTEGEKNHFEMLHYSYSSEPTHHYIAACIQMHSVVESSQCENVHVPHNKTLDNSGKRDTECLGTWFVTLNTPLSPPPSPLCVKASFTNEKAHTLNDIAVDSEWLNPLV